MLVLVFRLDGGNLNMNSRRETSEDVTDKSSGANGDQRSVLIRVVK